LIAGIVKARAAFALLAGASRFAPGMVDAFSESHNWYAKSYFAIDEGPIVIMIQNYGSGLRWSLFMSCPEVQHGLKKLNVESPMLK